MHIQVDIHSPFIYSDPTSGGVKENLALTGTDSFFGVTAQVQRTTREAQFYSAKAVSSKSNGAQSLNILIFMRK